MFIQTEQTPNPATLKFLPGRQVMPSGTANFTSAEAAGRSTLAERLFALPQVTGVFLGADFITVTKSGDGDWRQLKPAILAEIIETGADPQEEAERTRFALRQASKALEAAEYVSVPLRLRFGDAVAVARSRVTVAPVDAKRSDRVLKLALTLSSAATIDPGAVGET